MREGGVGSLLPTLPSSNPNNGGLGESVVEDGRRGLKLWMWERVWLGVGFKELIEVDEEDDEKRDF